MKIPNLIEAQGGPITLVFSKNGRVFFSERINGDVWEVLGEQKFSLVKHLPVIQLTGHHEAGLIGIALDPDFDKNDLIYAYYSIEGKPSGINNRVVRFKASGGKEQILIDNIPGGLIHNGGIIAFGPDGKLYVGVGVDNKIQEKAQDKSFLGGKILRINPDGTIPADNPFKDSPVYSYGHRNIFGLAFHPKTGKLYICEEGPDTDDEINIIEPGGNYGWPKVTGYSNKSEYIDPIQIWTPTITPTQSFFDGDSLYFGSFNDGVVHRLTLTEDGKKVISDEIVYRDKPWGIAGVFMSPEKEYFIATTSVIKKVKFTKGEPMKKSSLLWIIAAIVVLLLVGGIFIYAISNYSSPTNNNTQSVETNSVSMKNLSFEPANITVKKGDTVTWTNNDSTIHSIVADNGSFGLNQLSPGEKSTHKFDESGTIDYHCSIHPSMRGKVVVK